MGSKNDQFIKCEPFEPTEGISPLVQNLHDSVYLKNAEACKEEPPPEFVEAYQSLEDDTLVGLGGATAPKTPREFNNFRFDPKYQSKPHRETIANYVLQLSRNKELSPAGYQAVQNMLKSLFRMEGLAPDIDHDYQYTWILRTIMGECVAKGNLATRPYAFPQILAEQASIVLDHFQEDLGIGTAVDASPSPASPAPPSNSDKKVLKKSSTRKRKAQDVSTDEPNQVKPFDMGNPTIAAMMHNLHRRTGGISLIDRKLKRDYNRFGHNGLNVGDWWPYHVCALRDGAHGSSMGGIAGSQRDGAKSVVVAGAYQGMDKDEGDIIYYSGSNSHENTDPTTPHRSNGTKSLQRAMLDNRNIRVLRNSKGDSKYAPAVGIRYDGLYKIVKEEQRFNAKGGAYLRFKLVRLEGQPPIDLARPNRREKDAFAVLKQAV